MTDEIKKLNSLEDLERLKAGDFVKIKNYAEDEGMIFEGKLGKEYGFIEFNFPVIWSNRINRDDIKFENGMIKVEKGKLRLEMYSETDKCYKSKLNLINGAK